MKKLLFVIPTLFLMSLGLVSCLNDSDDSIYYFEGEPAIVEDMDGETPIIRTSHGKFLVPGLANKEVEKGDFLWSYFLVDMGTQANKDSLQASAFRYRKISEEKVILPEEAEEFKNYLNNDYASPFHLAELYTTYIDKHLFFGFYHKPYTENRFEYELVCNPEIEASNGYPTLYIRAKELSNSVSETFDSAEKAKGKKVVATFDMTEFLEEYGKGNNAGGKSVKFNLKYKIGTNSDGKDTYREFLSNPISWSTK